MAGAWALVAKGDDHDRTVALGGLADHHGQPLHTGGPADPGRRTAAHLFHQAVIPPARQHGALGAQRIGHEFKGRMGVIVEPADKTRRNPVADPQRIEPAQNLVEESAGGFVQMIPQQGSIGHDPLIALVLGIEDAHGIAVHPRAAVFGKIVAVFFQVIEQHRTVGFAAFRVAQGVDFQMHVLGHAQFIQQMGGQRDDLDIRLGPRHT